MNRKSGPKRRVFALVNTKLCSTGFVPLATLLGNWMCRRVNSQSAESMHTARSGTRRLARNNYRPFYSRVRVAGHSCRPTCSTVQRFARESTRLTELRFLLPSNELAQEIQTIITISPSYPILRFKGRGCRSLGFQVTKLTSGQRIDDRSRGEKSWPPGSWLILVSRIAY